MSIDTLSIIAGVLATIATLVAALIGLRRPKNRRDLTITVFVLALIIVAVVLIGSVLPTLLGIPSEIRVVVHVADNNGAPVARAKLLLFFKDGPLSELTDTNGVATFTIKAPSGENARLFVQTDKYEIYDQTVRLSGSQTVSIPLTPQGSNNRSVIVRVVDDSNGIPIDGAKVVFIALANTYNQSTDSNGLAKFTITFSGKTLDANISVSTPKYNIDNKKVTLSPDEVQDVRLIPRTNEVKVTAVEPVKPVPSGTATTNAISYGQILSGAITTPTEIDRHTFRGSAKDVVLIKIAKRSGEFWARIRLYGSDGNLLGQTHIGVFVSAELNFTLPVDGEYIILVDDVKDGAQTGEYNINLQKIR